MPKLVDLTGAEISWKSNIDFSNVVIYGENNVKAVYYINIKSARPYYPDYYIGVELKPSTSEIYYILSTENSSYPMYSDNSWFVFHSSITVIDGLDVTNEDLINLVLANAKVTGGVWVEEIEVEPTIKATITYNDSDVATIQDGQIATLKCSNKKMKSDVVVKVEEVEEVNLITFAIGGTTYQAEEGMTWADWVDSEYNTINAHTSIDGTGCTIGGTAFGIYADSERSINVVSTDIITNNAIYYTNHNGGSND